MLQTLLCDCLTGLESEAEVAPKQTIQRECLLYTATGQVFGGARVPNAEDHSWKFFTFSLLCCAQDNFLSVQRDAIARIPSRKDRPNTCAILPSETTKMATAAGILYASSKCVLDHSTAFETFVGNVFDKLDMHGQIRLLTHGNHLFLVNKKAK